MTTDAGIRCEGIETLILLVGVQIDAATIKTRMEDLKKLKVDLSQYTTIQPLGI